MKKAGGRKKVRIPRIIPVGGFLISLFAALSALGAILGGSASVANSVNQARNARKRLEEAVRHNKAMENITVR
ncbi:hypothetical protein ACXWPT_09585, partial [Streptococcus pyogenes]